MQRSIRQLAHATPKREVHRWGNERHQQERKVRPGLSCDTIHPRSNQED